MHVSILAQKLAAVICLTAVTSSAAVLKPARRALFVSDAAGSASSPTVVTPSTEPLLEVSNIVPASDGTWQSVRSLGGSLALEWLSAHQNGHPNTTVQWSNGTVVTPAEVAPLLPLTKRWGWVSPNLELLTFSISHFRVGDAGFQAGFMDATSSAILTAIHWWMVNGPSNDANIVEGNNNTPDNHFEPNIYYEQSVTKMDETGDFPKEQDMQNAAYVAMTDMTNKNYQGASYEVIVRTTHMDGSCTLQEVGQSRFCSWKWNGQCTTPPLGWYLNYHYQATNSGCTFGEWIG